MQGLKDFKSQHSHPTSFSSDDDDFDEDDDYYDDEEEDLPFMDKIKQLNLMKQANNSAAAATPSLKKIGNGGGNVNGNNGGGKKKGGMNHPNQNSPNALQAKGVNSQACMNPKMRNPAAELLGRNPAADGDLKRMVMMNNNNNNGMVGIGFQGIGNNNNMMQVRNNIGGFGLNQHQQTPMMGGMHGHQPSPMMMNTRGPPCNSNGMMMMGHDNRYMQHQQPQMMYNKSPQITPYTGYYYQCFPSPYYLQQDQKEGSNFGVHLFNDENTNSCTIM